MNTITVEVNDNSLALPADTMKQLGWHERTRIAIEKRNAIVFLRPQELRADEIENIAYIYLIEYVGDATVVKTPILKDGKWRVEVVLSYRPETIGFLTFSRDGQLIESESDSPTKLKGINI